MTPKGMTVTELRSGDETLALLDNALTAAEEYLKELLPRASAHAIVKAFQAHVQTHAWEELENIRDHGHRNDSPDDPPPAWSGERGK